MGQELSTAKNGMKYNGFQQRIFGFYFRTTIKLDEITYKTMMGEFIIYIQGKIVGGIYDDRFLVKPVKAAKAYMPTASYENRRKLRR